MAFKTAPLTPIPSGTEPQLYQYLMRLEEVVRGLTGGVNDAQSRTVSVSDVLSSGKMDKVFGTSRSVAILDGGGGLKDSSVLLTSTPTPGAAPIADGSGKLNAWVDLPSIEGFFEFDTHGALMPVISPTTSDVWELDGNGDIQPKAVI